MIRQAKKEDAQAIANLTVGAMEDLAKQFCASGDINEANSLFARFVALEDNQYSYNNALIYLVDNEIAGSISGYNGAEIENLAGPSLLISKKTTIQMVFKWNWRARLTNFT